MNVSSDISAVDVDDAGGVTGGVTGGGGIGGGGIGGAAGGGIGTNSCRKTKVIIGPFPSDGPPVC